MYNNVFYTDENITVDYQLKIRTRSSTPRFNSTVDTEHEVRVFENEKKLGSYCARKRPKFIGG